MKESTLDDIASWGVWKAANGDLSGDTTPLGDVSPSMSTSTCPVCGFTGQMNPPSGTMSPPKTSTDPNYS